MLSRHNFRLISNKNMYTGLAFEFLFKQMFLTKS